MNKFKTFLLTALVLFLSLSIAPTVYAKDNTETKSPEDKITFVKDHTLFVIENVETNTRSVFNPNAIVSVYAYNNDYTERKLMGSILVYGTAVYDGTNVAVRDYSCTVYSNLSNLVIDKTNLNVQDSYETRINAQIHYYDPYYKGTIYTGCGLSVFANGTVKPYPTNAINVN